MKKVHFLTGMPRAMTTLMANILANNPRIGGGETSPLLEYLYGARSNYSSTPEVKSALTKELMHKSFLEFCKQGIAGYADAITEKPVYLDKSRGWVYYSEFLKEFYPDAKIIVMVRDIRSVLSSFEKKWRENPSVLDGRDVPKNQQFITVDSRVNYWLGDPPLGIALKRIYNAIQTNSLDDMLIVRAEDLSKNPRETMREVYEYLGEEYYDLNYSDVKQVTVENDRVSDFGIYGDHIIRGEIKPLKDDYIEILGNEISRNVKSTYSWFFERFNYIK